MKKAVYLMKMARRLFFSIFALAVIILITVYVIEPEYAYVPPEKKLKSDSAISIAQKNNASGFDVWGKTITQQEADQLRQTQNGRELLSPDHGAIEVNQSLLQLGRKAFYQETFGNEVFLTDIMGIV